MKVIATIQIGDKETKLTGEAVIFDTHINHWLGDIGFWIKDWNYFGQGGLKQEGQAFVPWTSCLMVHDITGKEVRNEQPTS